MFTLSKTTILTFFFLWQGAIIIFFWPAVKTQVKDLIQSLKTKPPARSYSRVKRLAFLLVFLPSAPKVLAAENESISGYLDMYYEYNFNHPNPNQGNTQLRNFDVEANQFSLAAAELSYKRTIENLTLKLDLVAGDNTEMMHATAEGFDESAKHIGQAIISYTPTSLPALTINIGKMLTHVGWEGAKAKDDWNYSRSLLFSFAVPYWHNGISFNWAVIPDVFQANFYVYNGWNAMKDNNRGKTLGTQLSYTPLSGLSLTYNVIGGPEQKDEEKAKKIVHDLIASWTVNEQFSFAVDWAIGSEEKAITNEATGEKTKAKWSALQVGMKYAPSERFYLSPRLEAYWDEDVYTTAAAQTLREATLTASYAATPNLEWRFEARQDISNRKAFLKDEEAVKTQATLSLSTLLRI